MNGISYDKARKKYTARKTVDGQRIFIGRFKTKAAAEEALEMFNAHAFEADFEPLKQLITTPVSRPFQITKPTFIGRVKLFVTDIWLDIRDAWADTKY